MVMCEKGICETGRATNERRGGAWGQGGPVFVPPRKLSPLAQELLAGVEGAAVEGGVTAYDELWYEGCPRD